VTRVALTGGTGYVGGATIAALRGLPGVESRVLARSQAAIEGAEVVVGDVTDPDSCRRLVRDVDTVIHAAALVRSKDEAALERVNVEATRRLAAAARDAGVRRFVHVSTTGVLGLPGHAVDEAGEPMPLGAYEGSKLRSEAGVRQDFAQGWVIVRPSNVIGAAHPLQPLRRLLTRLRDGRLIVHGNAWTNYVDVIDVARTLAAAAIAPSAPPFLIINAPLPIVEFLALAAEAVGRPARTVRLPGLIQGLTGRVVGRAADRFPALGRVRALMDETRFVSVHRDWLAEQGIRPALDVALRDMAREYGLVDRS
jgi:nucleoside-diphosphate-sugar epimerase